MIRRVSPRARAALVMVVLLLGRPAAATAQADEPIGRFVADLRGSIVPFDQDGQLAAERGYDASLTPGNGFGLDAGVHVYLLRWPIVTIGLGASYHTSVATRHAQETDLDPDGPTLRKRFTSFAPQLSFNFGRRNGWSYLSGGLGTSRLSLFDVDQPQPVQRRSTTLNYGGGARWFVREHLAFSLDLRFYAIRPLEPTETEPGSPRMTVMVFSIGASFK